VNAYSADLGFVGSIGVAGAIDAATRPPRSWESVL